MILYGPIFNVQVLKEDLTWALIRANVKNLD